MAQDPSHSLAQLTCALTLLMTGPADEDDELLMDPLSLSTDLTRFSDGQLLTTRPPMVQGQLFYHTIKGGRAPSSMPGVTF